MAVEWELGFRGLFRALVDYGEGVYEGVLAPERDRARAELDKLGRFARLETAPPIEHGQRDDALSEWYALSRVLDYLLLSFSPPLRGLPPSSRKARQWRRPDGEIVRGAFDLVSASEYRSFAAAIGLQAIDPVTFSPIHSEIVEVIEDASVGDRIVLEDELWPGLRFGELIVSRGGAVVRAAPHVLAKSVAETSTLYATYWRSHRPSEDLSRGWGSNSQWNTSFRRDYVTATHHCYNVDGDFDVDGVSSPPLPPVLAAFSHIKLARDERISLITHRCFVVGESRSNADPWIYLASYHERN